uniref:Sushi domain-containing protein n=1 Tax=Caenorhabditis japonica TaxID=281687 RepID=A0A8R1I5J8_CAEJA
MTTAIISLIVICVSATLAQFQCGSSLKPEKLVVVGVWKRSFDNSTAQYRISDEDLSVRGYERANTDRASSTVMLARHPERCVITECGVRLSAMMQVNGAILHTDRRNVRFNDSTMSNIEDEFYCAEKNNSCGADVPVYRFVKHSLTGPHYAYSFDNVGQSLPGYEKEYFPLCFAWRQTPSVVLFNSSDDGVCLTLSDTNHGKITYSNNQLNVYSIGTTATLHCNHGFVNDGQSSLLCTKEGWYPKGGLGNCLEHTKPQLLVAASPVQNDGVSECQIPSSTPNGNIIYSANVATITSKTSVPTATRATVLCSIGYIPTNSAPSSKCVNGEWQPNLPSCVSLFELKCPILSAPRNGELVFANSSSSPYGLNSVILLKCDRNFYGIGNSAATCTSTGWDQKIGRCEAISTGVACAAIATPANGNILFMQANPTVEYSSGTSGYLMCNLGYSLSGSVSTMCTNGVWSPTIGQCTNALALGQTTGNCEAIPAITSGTITYSSIGTYPSGTTATLSCNLMNTVTGSTTSTCLSGVWNPPLGNCVGGSAGGTDSTGTTCTNPTVINGVITYSQGNTYDLTRPYLTTATLKCNSGYTLSGNSLSTCTGRAFTPNFGTCTFGSTSSTSSSSSTCTILIVINGQVTYSQGTPYDLTRPALTVATLMCNSGYTLSGDSTSTCTNGVFTPTLGTCNYGAVSTGTGGSTTTSCMNPILIGGVLTYSQGNTYDIMRPAGTTVTLTCSSGYTLSGNSQATCTNGAFTPPLGNCNYGSSPGDTTGTIQCTAMIAPLGGSVTYSNGGSMGPFPSGTTVTGTCTSGQISGASTATCSNGMWTPTFLGTCSLIGGSATGQCSALTVPAGAQATYTPFSLSTTSFTSGTVATVTCTTGGSMLGTTTCTNGIWSPSITQTCSNTGTGTGQCTTLTRPAGETVSYDGQSSFATSFTSGTIARVTCSNGTQIGQTTCFTGAWTPPITTTCSGSSTAIGTQCIGVIVPTDSQVVYSDGNMVLHSAGTTATLTCLNAATLTGNSYATCSEGVWTPTLGSCSSSGTSTNPCYTPPLTPTGATVTYSSGYFAPWTTGSTATMSCPSGQVALGNTISYCTNAAWSPAFGSCSGSTTGIGQANNTATCSFLPIAPPYGSIVTSQTAPYSSGTVVTLQCESGYQVQGNGGTSTCTNGVFTEISATCTKTS